MAITIGMSGIRKVQRIKILPIITVSISYLLPLQIPKRFPRGCICLLILVDLELGTCDNRGMLGPSQSQCEAYYSSHNSSRVLKEVRVVDEIPFKGTQKWRVPHEGFYT